MEFIYFKGRKRVLFYILAAVAAANLLFIFINSALPKAVSSEESSAVASFLAGIFPPSTAFGAFVAEYIRKIAHFLEYGALGVEMAVYAFFFSSKPLKCTRLFAISEFFVAFLDESIQILSSRGPAIADVWIDVFGFFTFYSLVILLSIIIKQVGKNHG